MEQTTNSKITDISSLIRNDNLENIDLSPFKDAPITDISYICHGCKKLKDINLGVLQNAVIKQINHAFYNCEVITSIDLSKLQFGSVSSLQNVFYGCKSLLSINWGDNTFRSCTNIQGLFFNCESLTSIDLSPLEGSKANGTANIFCGCKSLTSIDLSPLINCTFNANSTTVFSLCLELKTIIVPWLTAPAISSTMFGSSTTNYAGRNTYNKGVNKLYVPTGATGYDSGYWKDPLCNSSKCGFTIVYPPSNGVYIQHIDGSLYTESEWTSAGYANNTANGVAVVSDECSFVVAKENASSSTLAWGGDGILIEGVLSKSSSSEAIKDYQGKDNTEKIVQQLGASGGKAANACATYIFPNGKRGYLPALGELKLMFDNITTISSVMTQIGGALQNGNYGSSTQAGATNYWTLFLSSGSMSYTSKNNACYVRAFTTLF